MDIIINFLVFFIIVYLFYLIVVWARKRNITKYRNSNEIRFLEYKYKVKVDAIGIEKLSRVLAFWNALIISVTVVVISFINNFILKMLVGFVLLLPLIFIVYHLIAKYYNKKISSK